MPLPVWPAALPQSMLRDSFQPTGADDLLIKTSMEDGKAVSRRAKLARWTEVSGGYLLTPAQYGILRNFWLVTLNAGESDFAVPMKNFETGSNSTYTASWESGAPAPAPAGKDTLRVSVKFSVRDYI